MSAGIFEYPVERSILIAYKAQQKFRCSPSLSIKVTMCAKGEKESSILSKVYNTVGSSTVDQLLEENKKTIKASTSEMSEESNSEFI